MTRPINLTKLLFQKHLRDRYLPPTTGVIVQSVATRKGILRLLRTDPTMLIPHDRHNDVVITSDDANDPADPEIVLDEAQLDALLPDEAEPLPEPGDFWLPAADPASACY